MPAGAKTVTTGSIPPKVERPKPRALEAKLDIAKPPGSDDPAATSAEGQEGAKTGKATKARLIQPAIWEAPRHPERTLYRGQVLQGVTLGVINSDIPSLVRIQLTVPVLDKFGQQEELLPQGSLILAKQTGTPQFGQRRLAFALEEAQFPNGVVLKLDGMLEDRSGQSGLTGKVNNHYTQIVGATLLSAALQVGTRGIAGNAAGFQESLPQQYASNTANSLSKTGQSIIDKQLNVPPTIRIRAGEAVLLQLDTNLDVSGALPRTPWKQ
jgi:type IV secretion system protein VirB10